MPSLQIATISVGDVHLQTDIGWRHRQHGDQVPQFMIKLTSVIDLDYVPSLSK